MFGTNMEHPNRMLSFKEAHAKWASIKPIRGREDQNTRPLVRRGNDNLTIRQDPETKDIVVRLYHTDIVRYVAADGDGYNNLIELGPYPSSTTNRVVYSLLGPHVNPYWSHRTHGPSHVTEVSGRYYNTPEYALIQPDERGWHIVGGQKPFEVPHLNRKEGNAALKATGYDMFKLWLNTRIRLDLDPRASTTWRRAPYQWGNGYGAVMYLTEGEAGWAEVAGRMSANAPLKYELESLRRAVYRCELCYDTVEIPHFESHKDLQAALNRLRRAYD